MRCPAGGFENASGMKFCGECGESLKLKCPSCGFENAPRIKFCGDCGRPLSELSKPHDQPEPRCYTSKHLAEKILTSRSALEGERKQVKVLFADVKGCSGSYPPTIIGLTPTGIPLFATGRISILDHPEQTRELKQLERRARLGGRTIVDHPPRGHDDLGGAHG
jgi:hypothetical protein